MDSVEVSIGLGEQRYLMTATLQEGGWMPTLYAISSDGETETEVCPPSVQTVREAFPYPTPGTCIEAIFLVVLTELYGVSP